MDFVTYGRLHEIVDDLVENDAEGLIAALDTQFRKIYPELRLGFAKNGDSRCVVATAEECEFQPPSAEERDADFRGMQETMVNDGLEVRIKRFDHDAYFAVIDPLGYPYVAAAQTSIEEAVYQAFLKYDMMPKGGE